MSQVDTRRSGTEVIESFLNFARDIKISHTLFALPFAIAALLIARIEAPSFLQGMYLLLCMIGARSFAMGANRILDREIDEKNDRTRNRALPSGKLSISEGLFWTCAAAAIFVGSSFMLNQTAGFLSLPVLVILGSYSLTKRFSYFCHYYLGVCLGLAPVAVLIALGYDVPLAVYLLATAVACWTGGFDIIYALQDHDFDRNAGLNSVPVKFGVRNALRISRFSFLAMLLFLLKVGTLLGAGPVYYLGTAGIATILIWEHWIVRRHGEPGKSSNLTAAFFNGNASVSVLYLASVVIDRVTAMATR